MSNTVTKYSNQSIAAYGGDRDPFEILADDMAPQTILGQLIRFSKGDYLAGQDGDPVATGTVFLAAIDHALGGYIHWDDKKPDQQVMVPLATGAPLPQRYTLGDDDTSKWELVGNERRDPWQETFYLPLLSADDELYTFTTSSGGGRTAIGKLFREYGRRRRTGADEYPLVALSVEEYQHREYGRIKKPAFAVADWEPRTRFLDALAAAGIQPLDLPQPAPPPEPAAKPADPVFVPNKRARKKAGATLANELNDEIPY
jgi:hypothetical protein